MLDMTAQDAAARKAHDFISYVRVLGFRREAAPLLSAIQEQAPNAREKAAPLPLITRTADAASILDGSSLAEFRRDLYCSHIYQAVLAAGSGRRIANEYTTGLIVM